MNSKWEDTSLQDVTTIIGDGLHGTPIYNDEGDFFFINGNNLSKGRISLHEKTRKCDEQEYLKYKKDLTDRTILISINGTLGNIALYRGEKVFLGKSACYLNIKNNINKIFIRYVLENNSFQLYLQSQATGSTIKNASLKLIRSYRFKLPLLKVQQKIAKILGDLDDKIEINNQINETLEAMAQAIFKSWFVDFDPVRAKAEAKAAGKDDTGILRAAMAVIASKSEQALAQMAQDSPDEYKKLEATAKAFPDAFVESELGLIPEGWEVKPLSYFGNIVCGKTPSKKEASYYGSDIPFIKIPDMHGEVFITQTGEYLSIEGGNSQPKKAVPPNSIIVSCIATVGLVAITTHPSHTNQQINSIVPKKDFYTKYLFFDLRSKNQYLHDLASGGSATLNLNTGNFSKIESMSPSEKLLMIFDNNVEYLFERILLNKKENKTLTELRDSLLPKLLSGEIEV